MCGENSSVVSIQLVRRERERCQAWRTNCELRDHRGNLRHAKMITEDQTATIEFLAAPGTHHGLAVERIDTHASIVFVSGYPRVEIEAGGPLRLSGLLDGRTGKSDV